MPKTTSAPTSSSERTIAVAPSTSSTWGVDGAGGGTTCAGGRGVLRGGAGTGPLAMVTLLVVAVQQSGNKKPFDPKAGAKGCAQSDRLDRKSTRLNSSHVAISYAVFCLKKKKHSYSMRWD